VLIQEIRALLIDKVAGTVVLTRLASTRRQRTAPRRSDNAGNTPPQEQEMTLYLLNNFSTVSLVVIVVGGTTAVAVLASFVAHRLFPNLADSSFEEITGILRADVFALLYTVILALVISDLSGNLASASSTVRAEASALNGLTHATASFSDSSKEAMRSAIGEYVRAVVEDEWPALRWGEPSPRASAALEGLHATVRSIEPKTAVEQVFYESSVEELATITLKRQQRVQQSQDSLSPLLRVILIVGAIVFIILAYPASISRQRTRALIIGGASAFVSFAYLLTMVMDRPFAGDYSVDTTPYKTDTLALYWVIDSARLPPRPLTPETFERVSVRDLVGVWNSDSAFGEAVFRKVGGEIHVTYRYDKGTVVGALSPDGVFRGWWCEEGSRKPLRDAGEIEWRLLKTPESGSTILDGRWRYGAEEPFRGGWDLTKLEGKIEPPDLAARFADSASFCRHP
jgi:hypothetical protein